MSEIGCPRQRERQIGYIAVQRLVGDAQHGIRVRVNVVLVTSSYPLNPDDAEAAAGLFVRDLALAVAHQGHAVRVLTQARAGTRHDDPELRVERYAWSGDRPLSTLRSRHM